MPSVDGPEISSGGVWCPVEVGHPPVDPFAYSNKFGPFLLEGSRRRVEGAEGWKAQALGAETTVALYCRVAVIAVATRYRAAGYLEEFVSLAVSLGGKPGLVR